MDCNEDYQKSLLLDLPHLISVKRESSASLEISLEDYFPSSFTPFLHSLCIPHQRIFLYNPVSKASLVLPTNHPDPLLPQMKSIMTPRNRLFLLGGELPNGRLSTCVYEYSRRCL